MKQTPEEFDSFAPAHFDLSVGPSMSLRPRGSIREHGDPFRNRLNHSLPLTHAWSRAQKCLIIAAVLIALAAFGMFVYGVERGYHPADGNILAGTWEMTAPEGKDSPTVLRFDPERTAAWHSGAWVRYAEAGQQGSSAMRWYAGGRYIYMHFEEGLPQIWEIIQILPDELRLRHAKRDYTFKRI
jgi:hypothetical protein